MCINRQQTLSASENSAVHSVLSTAMGAIKTKREHTTLNQEDMTEKLRSMRQGAAAHILTSPVGIPAKESLQ